MASIPWFTWLEWHLFVMGTVTGLLLAVADRRGHTRLAVGGGILIAAVTMQAWVTHGWRVHPWYFAAPAAIILAGQEFVDLTPRNTDEELTWAED